MVELGELLVAILGTVPVLGAFVSVTAAYHMQLGSVSKQTGCAAVQHHAAARAGRQVRPPRSSPPLWRPRAVHGARRASPPPPHLRGLLITQ
eukprot:scaffold18229_cov66-Phaeocystis_antarctica.AAC.2